MSPDDPLPRGSRVSDLPAPPATRLPRARWLDARLLIGVLLVLLSVVLGARFLADADRRVRVWSVARDLGPDTVLTGDDLRVAAVRLDGMAGRYVAASEELDGLVLTRPVGQGELLPASAVRRPGTPDRRRLVVEVDRAGATGLAKGQVVDLFTVPEPPSGESPPPPRLVLAAVTVADDVRSADSAFAGAGSTAAVALLVDAVDVPDVLAAVAGGRVYVVQVPSPGAAQ
jgi:hypothetical protein